jgi:transcriptional regulator with XRE-family HTH domain
MSAAVTIPAETAAHDGDAYTAERTRFLRVLGQKLRAERNRRHLSVEGLAEIANVHRTHLNAVELGLRDPHASMLLILADALKVPPGTLLEDLFVPRERKPATHCKRGWPVPGREKPGETREDEAAGRVVRSSIPSRDRRPATTAEGAQ